MASGCSIQMQEPDSLPTETTWHQPGAPGMAGNTEGKSTSSMQVSRGGNCRALLRWDRGRHPVASPPHNTRSTGVYRQGNSVRRSPHGSFPSSTVLGSAMANSTKAMGGTHKVAITALKPSSPLLYGDANLFYFQPCAS